MTNRMDNLQTVFDRTDWAELANQKLALIKTMDRAKRGEDLSGFLNWLDAMQDAAKMDGYRVKWLSEDNDDAN